MLSDETLRTLAAKIGPMAVAAMADPYLAAEVERRRAAEVERYRLAERDRLGLPPFDLPLPRLSASDIRRKMRRFDAVLRPARYANRWKIARLRRAK